MKPEAFTTFRQRMSCGSATLAQMKAALPQLTARQLESLLLRTPFLPRFPRLEEILWREAFRRRIPQRPGFAIPVRLLPSLRRILAKVFERPGGAAELAAAEHVNRTFFRERAVRRP